MQQQSVNWRPCLTYYHTHGSKWSLSTSSLTILRTSSFSYQGASTQAKIKHTPWCCEAFTLKCKLSDLSRVKGQ